MNNDIISRSALMEQLHNHYAVNNPVQNAIMDEICMILMRAPSVSADQQSAPNSVIYCKDCDFCIDDQCHRYDDETGGMSHSTQPHGFCWLAKKRKVNATKEATWISNSHFPDTIICSNCKSKFDVWKHEKKDFRYCPHCGASMKMEVK